MGKKCCPFSMIAYILVVIGAISWGLVGVFGFDIVAYLADLVGSAMVAKILYILIGLSGLIMLIKRCHKGNCSIK